MRPLAVALAFAIIIGGGFALGRALPHGGVIVSERRPAAPMPTPTKDSILSGRFMSGFELYAADSFPFREALRGVKASMALGVFRQTDLDGLYSDASGIGRFAAFDEDALRQSVRKLNALAETLPCERVCFALIPSKDAYATCAYPGFDMDASARVIEADGTAFTPIGLGPALSSDDYYRTDLHWDQASLGPVSEVLADALGADFSPAWDASVKDAGAFYGVYAGQLALPCEPDRMRYLDSDAMRALSVSLLDAGSGAMKPAAMYSESALGGIDPYDFFLQGPQPIVVIDNPALAGDAPAAAGDAAMAGKSAAAGNAAMAGKSAAAGNAAMAGDDPAAAGGRELYVFRDSFGSSLAPILATGYARTTLIDLRYIDARVLPEYVDFAPGSDALFIYSPQVLESPTVLLAG